MTGPTKKTGGGRQGEGAVTALWWALGWLALPWAVLFTLASAGGRGDWERLLQRLGWAPARDRLASGDDVLVWVHAVSVGEVQAARPLLERMRSRWPRLKIWISVGTEGGGGLARQLPEAEGVGWLPLDADPCCRLSVTRLKPALVVIIETEIWPNLVSVLARRGVPVVLANGRVEAAAFSWYRRFRALFAPVLRSYRLVLAQSAEEAGRFLELGAVESRVRVCGNLKFDNTPSGLDPAERRRRREVLGLGEDAVLLVGGSTHPGEEILLSVIGTELRSAGFPVRLLLAPRDIRRVGGIGRTLERQGIPSVRRSALGAIPREGVVLLDTLGELPSLYALADLVFVGKSFSRGGGQNPIEPAAQGCALVFGPRMENFADVADALVSAGGAVQVQDATALRTALRMLLDDPGRRCDMGSRARYLVERRRGSSECCIRALEPLIDGASRRRRSGCGYF